MGKGAKRERRRRVIQIDIIIADAEFRIYARVLLETAECIKEVLHECISILEWVIKEAICDQAITNKLIKKIEKIRNIMITLEEEINQIYQYIHMFIKKLDEMDAGLY